VFYRRAVLKAVIQPYEQQHGFWAAVRDVVQPNQIIKRSLKPRSSLPELTNTAVRGKIVFHILD